jgi:uncharacterized membrane protein YphA (DoxX/SURF4 family)
MLAFVGRVLFAFLFISSGFQKLTSYNLQDGGPVMASMSPRMDTFLKHVQHYTGFDVPLHKEHYVFMLGAAIFLELAGACAFIINSSIGAVFLILFMVAVTPVMHAFWEEKEGSQAQLNEMINFFKNLSILGALLFYLGQKRR